MTFRYSSFIHIILVIIIVLLAYQIKDVWDADFDAEITDYPSTTDSSPNNTLQSIFRQAHLKSYYKPIFEKDLFRPQRTEWKPPQAENELEPAASVTTPDPELIVYGIVICEDLKQAWVRVNQQATERRTRQAKKRNTDRHLTKITEGDTLEGWVVKDIDPATICLTQGGKTLEFNLIEPGKPKQRIVQRTTYKNPRKRTSTRSSVRRTVPKKRTSSQSRLPRRSPTQKR